MPDICDNTFFGCGGLTTVIIPSGVASIGESAFESCDNLRNVVYTGLSDEWGFVSIADGNGPLLAAGVAFASALLGNVHAMSHPVSGFFGVPHGVANAVLLPNIVEYNALADNGRYRKIYNYIANGKKADDSFRPEMLVDELRKLNADLGIPATLSEVGVTEDKIPAMVNDAMKSGNILRNPRQSTSKDIERLYRKTL